jgi:hypothetical protein
MQEYRAYFMGEDGHISWRVDLVCPNEEIAQERAMALVDGHDVEPATSRRSNTKE